MKHQRDQISPEPATEPGNPEPENHLQGVDELTDIRGIGQVLARRLHELGIYRFQEIINLDADNVERVQSLIPDIERRMRRDEWIDQARMLYQSKYPSAT